MSKNQSVIEGEVDILTSLTSGTIEGVHGDPAIAVLANFVNGVRMATLDPVSTGRLADAAEYIVSGEYVEGGHNNEFYELVMFKLAEGLAVLDGAPA